MAKPRYIVCSQDRIIDQTTGLISHINVVDKLVVNRSAPQGPPTQFPLQTLMLTATWARESSDSESDEFEFELSMQWPARESERLASGLVQFPVKYYRIEAGVVFSPQTVVASSGELLFESRLRKLGSDHWQTQTFSIDVEIIAKDPSNDTLC